MSAWCTEKSSNIAQDISRLIDMVEKDNHLPKDTKEYMKLLLDGCAWDASKLMAFSTGAKWNVNDGRSIQQEGYEGYQEVAVKYGILDQTDHQKEICRIATFVDELEFLRKGDYSPNRTMIHELLSRTTLRHKFIDEVSDLIEQVTMGELEWPLFQRLIKDRIKRVKEQEKLDLNRKKALKLH